MAGAPARVLRVGFVGEWGYEIHLPADTAVGVWDRILEAGRAGGIRPFGVEAQRLLRLEKGHMIMGQDSDGLSYPAEAGMDWAVKADKPFFVGQRSLSILGARPLKRRLVGFAFPETYGGPVPRECELVIHGGEIAGRVTSAAFQPHPEADHRPGLRSPGTVRTRHARPYPNRRPLAVRGPGGGIALLRSREPAAEADPSPHFSPGGVIMAQEFSPQRVLASEERSGHYGRASMCALRGK